MKKRMLIFHHCGAIGGAGLSLLHIIKSIDKEKYDIQVVCPNKPSDMIKEIKLCGVDVIETEKTPVIFPHYNGGIKYAISIRTFRNILQLYRDRINVKSIIVENKPDIVVVNSMTMCFIGKYAKEFGKKTICFHRETYQRGILGIRTKIIKSTLSKYFDKIIFISEYDKKVTEPCLSQKYVIYDKVDIKLYSKSEREQERRKLGLMNDDKAVLYLGGVSKLKGGHVILQAVKNIKSSNVKILYVANTTREELDAKLTLKEKMLAALRISSNAMIKKMYQSLKNKTDVIFLPLTTQPEKYFSSADMVVFPAAIAHQARPIYEAGAAKIPIIVSDFFETSEFAQHKVNAITFKPNDSVDLATKIDWVIQNREEQQDIILENYKYTFEKHNFENLRDELKDVLEDRI